MSTLVKYNGQTLSPTPYVSRSYEAFDYGKRWGTVETFEIRGVYHNTGYKSTIKDLADIFSGQFKNFSVISSGINIIDANYTVVDEFSIDSNQFLLGDRVAYLAKLKSYTVPSGVIEPNNEYSFDSSDDGTVTVSHKISAKGIRVSASPPLQNAIDFVNVFVGQNAYTYCNPLFIDNSSGILVSRAESIDRLNAEYSVTDVYKYNTGVGTSQDYIITHTADRNEGVSTDYNTIDFNAEYKGSTINSNLSVLRQSVNSKSFLEQIKNLYGFATGSLLLNTFSISENSGQNSISVRANYLSGASSDITGYFKYTVAVDVDEIYGIQTYTLNGDFISRGPISVRRTAVTSFLSSIGNDYRKYTYDIITGSELYSVFKDSNHPLCGQEKSVSINHNTGLGKFTMNAVFDNRDCVAYSQEAGYDVKVEAAKPVYKLIPSANIEGHYVIQDLQCKSKEKTTLSVNCLHSGVDPISSLVGLRNIVSGAVFNKEAVEESKSIQSGVLQVSLSNALASDANIGLYVDFYDSVLGTYSTRAGGSKFGY